MQNEIQSRKSDLPLIRIAQAGEKFKYGFCSCEEVRERSWICLSQKGLGVGQTVEGAVRFHDDSVRGFELNENYSLS